MKYVTICVMMCLVASVASADTTWQVRNLWSFEDTATIDWANQKTQDSVGTLGMWGDSTPSPVSISGSSGLGLHLDCTTTTAARLDNLDFDLDVGNAGIKVSMMIRPADSYVGATEEEYLINRGSVFSLSLFSNTSYQGRYYPDALMWQVWGSTGHEYVIAEVYNSTDLFDGGWHNVSAAYDPFEHTMTMWLDGVVLATSACNVGVVDGPDGSFNPWIMIGTSLSGVSGRGYQGDIDEVSISTIVPEPATMTLLGIASLVGLLKRRRA